MRVLLDTDVVLDFLLKRRLFFPDADKIFVRLQNMDFEGFVSSITPINAFYTCRKENGKNVAFDAVRELLKVVEICPAGKSDLLNALSFGFSDYEDAVQRASAIAANLNAIITRNTKDYTTSPVPVHTPAEFLKNLQNEPEG